MKVINYLELERQKNNVRKSNFIKDDRKKALILLYDLLIDQFKKNNGKFNGTTIIFPDDCDDLDAVLHFACSAGCKLHDRDDEKLGFVLDFSECYFIHPGQ